MARPATYQLKQHKTGQWYVHWKGSKKYFGTDRKEAEKRKGQFLAEQEGDPYRAYREFLEQSQAEGEERRGRFAAAMRIVEAAEAKNQPTFDGGKPLGFALDLWNNYAEVRSRSNRTKEEKQRYYGSFRRYMAKHFAGVTLLGLKREHFKGFRDYCLSKYGRKSPIKCNKSLQITGEVLRRAYREEPDHFSDGLLGGLELLRERAPYSPSPFNEAPYPADEFRALVAACDKMAEDERLRDKALLHCFVNFGLDCSDVSTLQWKHLVLDASTPYFDMTRAKFAGRPTERYTRRIIPIAKSTLKHLEAFKRECGRRVKPDDFVFVGKRGTALTAVGLNNTNGFLPRLKKLAGHKTSRYSPKHLRNVGSNIAREAGLGLDVIDYFLGHTIDSEARKYLSAEASARLAVPLVELLESRYFNGTTKGKPRKPAV